MSAREAKQREEARKTEETKVRKQFVEPELKKHSSLPRVTSGFAASFIP